MKRSLLIVALLAPLALTACDRPSTPTAVTVTTPEPAAPPPVVVQVPVPVAVPGPPGPQGERGEPGRKEMEREHPRDTVIVVPVEKKRD